MDVGAHIDPSAFRLTWIGGRKPGWRASQRPSHTRGAGPGNRIAWQHNNGEQQWRASIRVRRRQHIFDTSARGLGWMLLFFLPKRISNKKRAATAPPPNGAWIASERAVVDRFIHIGSSFGGFVVAVAEGAGKIRPSASIIVLCLLNSGPQNFLQHGPPRPQSGPPHRTMPAE